MNDPRRHHYNPEFYLSQWAAPDGLVCEINKAHGKVEAQRQSPKSTGFERDLYRTVGVPDEQHIEKTYMSRLDNDAASAFQKSLSGDGTEWSGAERTAWTTFILSLLFRNPENVTIIKDHIRDLWEHAKTALEANYAERRLPTYPETFDGYMALSKSKRPWPQRAASCRAAQLFIPASHGRLRPEGRADWIVLYAGFSTASRPSCRSSQGGAALRHKSPVTRRTTPSPPLSRPPKLPPPPHA